MTKWHSMLLLRNHQVQRQRKPHPALRYANRESFPLHSAENEVHTTPSSTLQGE